MYMPPHEEDLRLIPTTQTTIMDQINTHPNDAYTLGGDFNCDICSMGKQNDQPQHHYKLKITKNYLNSITILLLPNQNWYHNFNPHNGPFLDSHVITHFKADTITYEEPTNPLKLKIKPGIEKCVLHILCIHQKRYIHWI